MILSQLELDILLAEAEMKGFRKACEIAGVEVEV